MTTTQLAHQHRNLIDIDDVAPFIPERDQPLFDEIKTVLAKHDALSRFGVCLLHRHFDVNKGEMLVETCDEQNRLLTIRPMDDARLPSDTYIETNWRFDTKTSHQACLLKCLSNQGSHKRTVHSK